MSFKQTALLYLITLLVFFLIDMVWLGPAQKLRRPLPYLNENEIALEERPIRS